MADLSAYIDFSAVLNKGAQTITLIDPDHYPAGVDVGLTGIFSITQPDGITVTGTFTSPDVFWTGTQLNQPAKVLRLNNINSFQNGGYTITYTVRHAGFTDTVLTKVFTLFYTVPSQVITPNFDLFVPQLSVSDATAYTQTGMTNTSVVRTWAGTIITVSGTSRNISGGGVTFDLAYLGSYYDSRYDVTLTVQPQQVLDAPSGWVTLIDNLQLSATYYAQIPPVISVLDDDMLTLKNQLDAAQGSCLDYDILLHRYLLASALYGDFRRLGCDGQTTTLNTILYQLLKIFNNDVNPTYVNTNGPMSAYNFQCGSGTGGSGSVLIEFVASGTQSTYSNVALAGIAVSGILLVRNGLPQFNADPGDGDSYYTKILSDNFLTFHPSINVGDKIILILL